MINYAEDFLKYGEYAASGLYEEPEKSLFVRKARGLRRYYENCPLWKYEGKPLYPSGVAEKNVEIFPHYIDGFNFWLSDLKVNAPHLSDKIDEDFRVYKSVMPLQHTVAGNMYTHSMPNYERVLAEGLVSYGDRIKKIEDSDLREGLLDLLEGICDFIDRCVEYLRSENADEKLIRALEKVPKYPAENIYEAILSWNFVMYLDTIDNLGDLGRGLAPYWKGEDIIDLLGNLYDNLDINDGYSMSLDCSNPDFAEVCLEAAKGKRRPMIEFFVDENTPDRLWKKAFEVVRSGGGQPAFYNPKIFRDGLRAHFPEITEEDALRFCGGGCTEAMLSGITNVGSLDAGVNILYIFEGTLKEKLCSCETFDEFYSTFMSDAKHEVDYVLDCINLNREKRAVHDPLPMRTLLIDDCIDRGVEFNNFGARYSWSIISYAGLVNVIDSLLAVKTLVYDKKKYSAEDFLARLEKGEDPFVLELRELEMSHGRDIPEVNEFVKKFTTELFSFTDGKELWHGLGFLCSSILFNAHAAAGRRVGATPDGRRAGEPIADSLAAIFGKDTDGPTALLGSVTSIALDKALGVPVVNFNVQPDFHDEVLKSLVLGYMMKGGAQLQMTCMSKETLLDAYDHPENYKNLIVRVGGYSDYFNNLGNDMKMMIINRTIQASSLT
ncbi:MAG: hypothetical protein E7672_06685 [Ruminococcaceae bacterium]|nr:hypothetical protein [Oscillospiraceae bacterium]